MWLHNLYEHWHWKSLNYFVPFQWFDLTDRSIGFLQKNIPLRRHHLITVLCFCCYCCFCYCCYYSFSLLSMGEFKLIYTRCWLALSPRQGGAILSANFFDEMFGNFLNKQSCWAHVDQTFSRFFCGPHFEILQNVTHLELNITNILCFALNKGYFVGLPENNYFVRGSLNGRPPFWLVWIQLLSFCLINHKCTCLAKSNPVKQEVSDTSLYKVSESSLSYPNTGHVWTSPTEGEDNVTPGLSFDRFRLSCFTKDRLLVWSYLERSKLEACQIANDDTYFPPHDGGGESILWKWVWDKKKLYDRSLLMFKTAPI